MLLLDLNNNAIFVSNGKEIILIQDRVKSEFSYGIC